ncbi:MAG: hypothetical protein ACLTPC_19040 [Lacrimispora saccharolytica]
MLAHQWFDRCWFSIGHEMTFLSYLIDYDLVNEAMDYWTDLEIYQEQDDLDEDDKEDMAYYKEELDTLFKEYKEYYPESFEFSVEEAMEKVVKWSREREELLNASRNAGARENNR